jgi:hypothetical protein
LALFWPYKATLLDSAKFQVKLITVGVIILNGLILNFFISPKLTSIVFNDPSANTAAVNRVRRLSPIFGGISITSWIYAFLLGSVGNLLDLSFKGFLTFYLAMLAAGITGVFTVTKIKFRAATRAAMQQGEPSPSDITQINQQQ